MKKIFLILSILISGFTFSQVKIGLDGGMHSTGAYPTTYSNENFGGLWSVKTIAQRNAIPSNFRDTGMLVYVKDELKYYSLKNGKSNSDWVELSLNGKVIAAYGLINVNDSTLKADSLQLTTLAKSYKIVDSLDKLYLKLTGGIVTGTVDIQQPLSLGEGGVSRGRLNFFNEDNGNTGSLSSIPYTSNREWLLPDYDGTLTTEDSLRSKTDSLLNIINGRATFGDVRDIVEDTANVLRAKLLADSTTLASSINSKVNISDTANMLSGYKNATILTSGTLADARLSSNVPKMVSNVLPAVDGSLLTNLNPASIATVIQTITATATINNSTTTLLVNPATVVSSLSITLCAAPYQTQIIRIVFGGTITSGNKVVTTLSILPNSGQSVVRVFPSVEAFAGDFLAFQYINTNWYQIN